MSDVLRTERLTLRRAEPGDVDDLHAVFTAAPAMRYWSTPPHQTRAETEAFVQMMVTAPAERADEFVMLSGGRVIGKLGAWALPEIGFILHPAYWRQGLMSEALAVVIPWLFARHPDMPALTADVDPRNVASLRLLAAFGFVETGRAARTLLWGDEWCDSVYLAKYRKNAL